MKLPDIAMCWDGQTETAELRVSGVVLNGHPRDVEFVFHELNRFRDRAQGTHRRLQELNRAIHELAAKVEEP